MASPLVQRVLHHYGDAHVFYSFNCLDGRRVSADSPELTGVQTTVSGCNIYLSDSLLVCLQGLSKFRDRFTCAAAGDRLAVTLRGDDGRVWEGEGMFAGQFTTTNVAGFCLQSEEEAMEFLGMVVGILGQ